MSLVSYKVDALSGPQENLKIKGVKDFEGNCFPTVSAKILMQEVDRTPCPPQIREQMSGPEIL